MIDLDAYTDFCESVWVTPLGTSPNEDGSLSKSAQVMTLGLAGEVGEVMEYIKKYVRDGTVNGDLLRKELGDVFFYWCMIARHFGFTPEEIINANVEKLQGRVQRGTQRGSGDLR